MLLILLDCSLKATLLLALACAALALLGRATAALRHLLWTLALAGVLILPPLALLLPGWHVLPPWTTPPAVLPAPLSSAVLPGPAHMDPLPMAPAPRPDLVPAPRAAAPIAPITPAPSRKPAFTLPALATLLTTAYMLGLVAALVPVVRAYRLLLRLSRDSAPADYGWLTLLHDLRQTLGIVRPVRLLFHPAPLMPMTWAFLQPIILLPRDADHWPPERRRCVLLHELAHIKRCDALTFLLARLTCALYWFHPLAWFAAARLRATSELACDDLVLSAGTKGSTYAAQLVTLAQQPPASLPAFSTCAAIAMARPNRPSQLHTRVTAILDHTRNRRKLTLAAALACLLVSAGLVFPLAMLRAQTAATSPGTTTVPSPTTMPSTATAAAAMPAFADLEQLLGQTFDSPGVKDFVARYQLRENRAGKYPTPTGVFTDDGRVPFILYYADSRIDRIDITINHGHDSLDKTPLYTNPLPGGVLPTDSLADVTRRLGPPAYSGRDYLAYEKPPLSFQFDQTTHQLVDVQRDAAYKPPVEPLISTAEFGAAATIDLKRPLAIPPETAALLFDNTPTRLREGWQAHLPDHIANVPSQSSGPDARRLIPPDSTDPRAHVTYFNSKTLHISIIRPIGSNAATQFADEIADLMVPRTPALEKIFDLPNLEKTYNTTYRGLHQGDPLTYVTQDLGKPEDTERSPSEDYYTLIYAKGTVRITIWYGQIHTIIIAAPTTSTPAAQTRN